MMTSTNSDVAGPIFDGRVIRTPDVASTNSGSTNFGSIDSGSTGTRLADRRGVTLATLFLVTGFLGLPLLWINRNFTTSERWFWAIANTIYTTGLIYAAYRIVLWAIDQIGRV